MSKELRSLLVSAETIAEETLAETLHGLVSIVEGSGEIMPSHGLTKLDVPSQITAYLLARRAGVVLQQKESASATASEIAGVLHLDVQRVREALSRLKGSVVARSGDGYEIPLIRIETACEQLSNKRRRP
jgi:hypothetical protein